MQDMCVQRSVRASASQPGLRGPKDRGRCGGQQDQEKRPKLGRGCKADQKELVTNCRQSFPWLRLLSVIESSTEHEPGPRSLLKLRGDCSGREVVEVR
jgi:hypothetical protein